MAGIKAIIEKAYAAFNNRDIDGALALMTRDVRWPKASEGGHVVGKEDIRGYWTRQWSEFDPYVEPLEISEESSGCICVRVRQIVKSHHGQILSDGEVCHAFTVVNGLIAAMNLKNEANQSTTLPTAFPHSV